MKNHKLVFRVIWIVSALLAAFNSFSAQAKEPLVVLYPEMREPYRAIFDAILDGIKDHSVGEVVTLALAKEVKLEDIQGWLAQRDPGVIVSLGNRGRQMAVQLREDYRVITGATILSDDNVSQGLTGISLSPAPERLFQQLRKLAPNIEQIRVIYHPHTNSWLIKEARQAAEEAGLKLIAEPAESAKDAAPRYRDLLTSTTDGKDALWLLQGDPTLDERGLLPLIMGQAWEKNLLVFSSNPSHVQRGALFSLFPDNLKLGQRLAEKARQVAIGKDSGAETMRDLRIAVNIRTAEHLGLKISRVDRRGFDLVFPQQ